MLDIAINKDEKKNDEGNGSVEEEEEKGEQISEEEEEEEIEDEGRDFKKLNFKHIDIDRKTTRERFLAEVSRITEEEDEEDGSISR